MSFVSVVLFERLPHNPLTYKCPERLSSTLEKGAFVEVPFRHSHRLGVVIEVNVTNDIDPSKTKLINQVLTHIPALPEQQIELAKMIAQYYRAPIEACIKLISIPGLSSLPKRSYRLTKAGHQALVFHQHHHLSKKQIDALVQMTDNTWRTATVMKRLGFSKNDINTFVEKELLREKSTEVGMTSRQRANLDKSISTRAQEDLEQVVYRLNEEQQHALTAITADASPCLLEGVTGSGKTEVYIHAIQHALTFSAATSPQALLLVPEISLTPQLSERLSNRLPYRVALVHSQMTQKERRQVWFGLLHQHIDIVVGPRSALFLPFSSLEIVIVDEAHDTSFKQMDTPMYHARDVALYMGQQHDAKVILGTATPDLELIHLVNQEKLKHLQLTKRATQVELPEVELIDMRARAQMKIALKKDRPESVGSSQPIFSNPLAEAIQDTLAAGQQTLLFLNRRGYASQSICTSCGHMKMCPTCDITLTYYKNKNKLLCHYCGYGEAPTSICPECHEESMSSTGIGTERVEHECRLLCPEARITRLDRDVIKNRKTLVKVLNAIRQHEVDIIIGTQMVTKGHDFPNLSLVGVLYADLAFAQPDFRAYERGFQQLIQVAGRAGRHRLTGEDAIKPRVMIQTYQPDEPLFDSLITHDVKGFREKLIERRQRYHYPPYRHAALLRIEHPKENIGFDTAVTLFDLLQSISIDGAAQVIGPAPAPITRLYDRYRFHITIFADQRAARTHLLSRLEQHPIFQKLKNDKHSRIKIDIDPVDFS